MASIKQLKKIRKNGYKVIYECDMCRVECISCLSHFERKKRHFCSSDCYSRYRKEEIPFYEQNTYKGVRKKGESKQVYHRRYCRNNPKVISHLKARRYARQKGAEGSHTLKEWEQLKKGCNYKCKHCGLKTKLTKDHIIPLSEGGTDYISNIQPLCRNCNSKKWKHIYENPELLTND